MTPDERAARDKARAAGIPPTRDYLEAKHRKWPDRYPPPAPECVVAPCRRQSDPTRTDGRCDWHGGYHDRRPGT